MHEIAFNLMVCLVMLGGLANLFFPKQVMRSCRAFDRLFPFPNYSPLQESVTAVRVSGFIAVGISLAILIGRIL
jgi:hypothetical protein